MNTTKTGFGGIILNNKRTDTVLVHQKNRWKFITDTSEINETIYDTVIRECHEELSLKITNKNIQLFNIYNTAGTEYNTFNFTFVIVLDDEESDLPSFMPDMKEVKYAKWFQISDPLKIYHDGSHTIDDKNYIKSVVVFDHTNYDYPTLRTLSKLNNRSKKGNIELVDNDTILIEKNTIMCEKNVTLLVICFILCFIRRFII